MAEKCLVSISSCSGEEDEQKEPFSFWPSKYIDYFGLNTGADKASNTLGLQPAQHEVVNCQAKESLEL